MFYFRFKDTECFLKIKSGHDLFAILFIFRFCFFNPQPFAQFGVIHDPFHLVVDDGLGIRLDLVVIALNLFKHDVIPLFILEGVDNRYSLVCLFFGTHSGMVHNNFRMENLLVNFLTEVVRYGTYKGTL